jgi:hypothetical protein
VHAGSFHPNEVEYSIMKTILSLSTIAFALVLGTPSFAQTPMPTTKADCEKAKGTWDDASKRCVVGR